MITFMGVLFRGQTWEPAPFAALKRIREILSATAVAESSLVHLEWTRE